MIEEAIIIYDSNFKDMVELVCKGWSGDATGKFCAYYGPEFTSLHEISEELLNKVLSNQGGIWLLDPKPGSVDLWNKVPQ
jgi:hypothetical protein